MVQLVTHFFKSKDFFDEKTCFSLHLEKNNNEKPVIQQNKALFLQLYVMSTLHIGKPIIVNIFDNVPGN